MLHLDALTPRRWQYGPKKVAQQGAEVEVEATTEDQKLGVKKMSAQWVQKCEQGRLRAMTTNAIGVPHEEGIPHYIVCTPTICLLKGMVAIPNAPMATSPINHHHNAQI
jgi:hypothetical protein